MAVTSKAGGSNKSTTETSSSKGVSQKSYNDAVAKHGQAKIDGIMKTNNLSLKKSTLGPGSLEAPIGNTSTGTTSPVTSAASYNTNARNQGRTDWATAYRTDVLGIKNNTSQPVTSSSSVNNINRTSSNRTLGPGSLEAGPDKKEAFASQAGLIKARAKLGGDEQILAKAAKMYGEGSPNYKKIQDAIFKSKGQYYPNNYVTQSGAIQSDLYENTTVPNTDKAVDKTNLGVETSIDEQARKKTEIQAETARREREAVEEANRKKDDRILNREAMLQGVMGEYKSDTEATKKAIDENVKNLSQAQAAAARIAAGQAGQGATMSESARQAVEADISNRYAQNVAEAEGAAITQKYGIDEAQKTAGIQNITEQDKIDVLMNSMTDAEYAVFIKSVQDIGITQTLAKDKYANFIYEQNATVSEAMLNRKLRELKTAQNQNMFKTGTKADKIELIDSQLKDVPGYNNFKAKTIDLIGKGLELDDIIATISGLAQTQFEVTQAMPQGIASYANLSAASKAKVDQFMANLK